MKTQMEEATIVLITPLWQTQPWFPVLLTMIVDIPILLPPTPDLLSPSPNCDCPVRECQPPLVTWKVSGKISQQREFQRMLPDLSFPLGGVRPTLTIPLPGEIGGLPPFKADVSAVLSFLADEYEAGRHAVQIPKLLSLISTLPPVKGIPVGQHPLVIQLLKGAFNL